jgi:predicted ribosomally synthesized peptide with SipW-like signal peptide
MKKIIGLGLAVLLIVAAAGSGTWAFFSDSETSQDNTMVAGTLDLQVGASDPCTESIDLGLQLQPGDGGNAVNWTVANKGSVSGTLRVDISAVVDYENTRTEPEEAAGDTTAGSTDGELSSFIMVAIWLDNNQSGSWNSGDSYLGSDGTVVDWVSGSTLPVDAYDYLHDYAGLIWDSANGMPLIAGSGELDFMVEYNFPGSANDNRTQGDSCQFDITFTLEQVIT